MRAMTRPTIGVALVAVAVSLLLGTSGVDAALTAEGCQAKKLKAHGNLSKCHVGELAKAVQGKPADLAKCATKFSATVAKLNGQAAAAGISCRYRDNLDGTLTDLDTGLQWEKKTNDGSVHDVGNLYSWSSSGTEPDGTFFTAFLRALNNCESSDGTTVTGGFAGRCDWRLPSIEELEGIVDQTAPGCGSSGSGDRASIQSLA